MLKPKSPVINTMTGPLGNAIVSTSQDGQISLRPRRKDSGAGGQSVAWRYCIDCVRALDLAALDMDYWDKQEWGICPMKVRGKALSWLGEFYRINIRRMFYQMPGLTSPPDAFKSHQKYLLASDAFVTIKGNPKTYGVWTDGESKDGTPFDEETGPIPPPEPPNGWEPPPEGDQFCPLDTFCLDNCAEQYFITGLTTGGCYFGYMGYTCDGDYTFTNHEEHPCFWYCTEAADPDCRLHSNLYCHIGPTPELGSHWYIQISDDPGEVMCCDYIRIAHEFTCPAGNYALWLSGCDDCDPTVTLYL